LRARFLIIHNPHAGPIARHLYRASLSSLRRRGADLKIVQTASHGEGMEAAAEAALSGGFDAVVAAEVTGQSTTLPRASWAVQPLSGSFPWGRARAQAAALAQGACKHTPRRGGTQHSPRTGQWPALPLRCWRRIRRRGCSPVRKRRHPEAGKSRLRLAGVTCARLPSGSIAAREDRSRRS
jgi:hypothetical protein